MTQNDKEVFQSFAAQLAVAIREYYSDPKNMEAYKEWLAEREKKGEEK